MGTVSGCWVRVGGTGFVMYLCASQSILIYKSSFIQCKCQSEFFSATTVSHSCVFSANFFHGMQENQSLPLVSSAHVEQGGDFQPL